MNWHEFIFSEKPADRVRRHVIFWLLWWAYFTATYDYYLQVGLQKIVFEHLTAIMLVQSMLLILIHLVACYFFIYILLPNYLIQKKYLQLTGGVIVLVLFLSGAGYFVHSYLFPVIDAEYYSRISSNNTLWWTNINSGLLSAPKVITAAAAIKLIKRWYLKQKEKERIEKEKLITDLQLMKAQIRPGFLFNSLDQIHNAARKNSPQAQELLLKLADLLSYLLYECDEAKVPLEKELKMMKEYMILEKARFGERLELETVIKGDASNKKIAPLLLLPFIENSFKHCDNEDEQAWINLDIKIDDECLSMKLIHGVPETESEDNVSSAAILNIQKRLQLLYPGKHELKKYIDHEIHVTHLKIRFSEKSEQQSSEMLTGLKLKENYALN